MCSVSLANYPTDLNYKKRKRIDKKQKQINDKAAKECCFY